MANTKKSLAREFSPPLAGIRAAYRAELDRFACELRPRVLPGGDLSGLRDATEAAFQEWMRARDRLEELARERFAVAEDSDEARANAALVMLMSPSAGETDHGGADILDPRSVAGEAVALDLIALARRRGWLPDPDTHEGARS